MKNMLEVPMLFDDVQFGIDVRETRKQLDWTQDQLAHMVGFADGASISAIEVARKTEAITVRRYMAVCNVLGLNPMHYWDCVPEARAGEGWESWDAQ